ncbi:MAG: enoyl-CoA hydratase/isomerase family protein, partial [Owenweeksia sp.]
EWRSASWAHERGLYNDVFDTAEAMDEAIAALVGKLKASNPEAMRLLKEVFWKGTEDWDDLLAERAAMSGKLVLSDFTKSAIEKFKKK